MKIAVISDSHDHLPNLRYVLADLKSRNIDLLIHCGDLISPFVTRELGNFDGPVHTVFGNNDGDRFLSLKVAGLHAPNVTHHGEFGFLEVEGRRIGFSHYGEYARGLVASGQCEAAFFGHTHVHRSERFGEALVLNPGEVLGMLGKPSYCIYDTEIRGFERVVFNHQPW